MNQRAIICCVIFLTLHAGCIGKSVEFDNDAAWVSYGDSKYAEALESERARNAASGGDYSEALKAYDKALELNPDNAEAWRKKGNIHYEQNDWKNAIKAYDKYLEFNIVNQSSYTLSTIWEKKSKCHYYLKEYDEALKSCEHALEMDPDFPFYLELEYEIQKAMTKEPEQVSPAAYKTLFLIISSLCMMFFVKKVF